MNEVSDAEEEFPTDGSDGIACIRNHPAGAVTLTYGTKKFGRTPALKYICKNNET